MVATGLIVRSRLATGSLCALFLMLLTHTLWGTTWIDEMHEVAAYFAVGLVAFYVAMAGIASSGHIEDRLRKMFGGNKGRTSPGGLAFAFTAPTAD